MKKEKNIFCIFFQKWQNCKWCASTWKYCSHSSLGETIFRKEFTSCIIFICQNWSSANVKVRKVQVKKSKVTHLSHLLTTLSAIFKGVFQSHRFKIGKEKVQVKLKVTHLSHLLTTLSGSSNVFIYFLKHRSEVMMFMMLIMIMMAKYKPQ